MDSVHKLDFVFVFEYFKKSRRLRSCCRTTQRDSLAIPRRENVGFEVSFFGEKERSKQGDGLKCPVQKLFSSCVLETRSLRRL